jgi:hypothetical protein
MAVPSLWEATAARCPAVPGLGLIGRPLKPTPLQAFVTPAASAVTGWYQRLDAIGQ